MRLFSLTVGRNEAHRYLYPMLIQASEIFDDAFFFDDRSEDETVALADMANCTVVERPDYVAPFREDEGKFRGGAWQAFEQIMQPTLGDWILAIDCDEFVVSWYGADPRSVRAALEKVIAAAGTQIAVDLPFVEVFGFDQDDCPLIRTDRLWGKGHAPRLFTYRPGGAYSRGRFGVPAVPSYVMAGSWFSTDVVTIMHYGYAEFEDQELKYARYNGQPGHGDAHVQSIVARDKKLERWDGPYMSVRAAWRNL